MKLHSDTYHSYKNAEGEWSETIPSEWQEKRVKDLFKLVTDAAPADNDYELLSLYAGIGVKPRKELEARGNKASSTDGYWIVKKNDIVVNKLLAWMGSVGLSEYDGVTSPAYDVLRQVQSDIDPRYFSYLFRTESAKKIFRKNSRGIMDMRLRLYFDKLGAIIIPVPPYNTQVRVADYIDTKFQQINKKIQFLDRKAALYDRLRSAITSKVVTQGLDKNTQMKDSGVGWLGMIPKHWCVERLKNLTKIKTGGKDTIDNVVDGAYPFFVRSQTVERINTYSFDGEAILTAGDGVGVGKVFHHINGKFDCHQRVYRISHFRKISGRFLFYFMRENFYKDALRFNAKATVDSLRLPMFMNFSVAFPDYAEQEKIVQFLDNKLAIIDRYIEKNTEQINSLKKLRVAMVNDAITGKIKVSELSRSREVAA